MNTLGKLFLQGLAVVIPAALTVAILWWLALGAERLLRGVLVQFLPEGWYMPGMGVVSAVAITLGASADARYDSGVAVFTLADGGLMLEASVGGQKFRFDPVEDAPVKE